MTLAALFAFFLYPLAEPLLGPQYQGLRTLVVIWLIYFAIALARNIFMATLMVDANGYRILHHITWAALVLAVPAFVLLSANGAVWVVSVLCATELLQLALVAVKAQEYWHQLDSVWDRNA